MKIVDPVSIKGMEAAWRARSREADGQFVVAVTTTRIYCRPSCPARQPKAENVLYYRDTAAARADGYRACKRCLPDDVGLDRQAVARAREILEQAQRDIPLAELAGQCGYSPSHFQRLFTRETGLSPAAYARRLKAERAEDLLASGHGVTDTIYEAGFSSPARFYDAMEGRLGMVPSAWAQGGKGVTIHWGVAETSLGSMLLATTDKGVCRLSFGEGVAALEERFPQAELVPGGGNFAERLAMVLRALERPEEAAAIPLDVDGTPFQKAVWAALRQIPPGETRSYAEIAAAAGRPRAVRAAGSANGANNVAVLIPCHRVVRSDGSIGGYAYGAEIKRELLRREGASTTLL